MRLLKNITVTQMLLLRFQITCAVVFSTFATATGNPECRVPSRSQTSQICRRQHHASAGAITIAVQFASKRGIAKTRCCSPPSASLPPPQIRNAACRHNHRRIKFFGGNFTHSHIRRRRHDRRSTRIETRHRQNATRATGRNRRIETTSFKYPSIRCYCSSSRYQ